MRTPPRHWARVEQHAHAGDRDVLLRVWGCSDVSEQDAEAQARSRISAILAAGGPGRGDASWYYPRGPLREELLEQLHDEDGALLATVTRNRYGAQVLCTDAVLIADIDLPAPRPMRPGPPRRGLWERLRSGLLRRGGTGASDAAWAGGPSAEAATTAEDAPSGPEAEALARVDRFATAHPRLGVHLHRTRAGFRVLVTGSGAAPDGDEAEALLRELGSDPLYVRLCRADASYRARLTPKPWRAGTTAPRVRWPASAPREEQELRDWVARYEQCCAGFAATRRLSRRGPAPSPREARVLELHDRSSRADSGLPLA